MSLKRPADEAPTGSTDIKRAKASNSITWTPMTGRESTLLHGIHLNPPDTTKAILFDLDDTLIKTKSGATFARNSQDWKWWASKVPEELARLAHDGFAIVIVSNQAGLKGDKQRAEWKRKLQLIADSLPNVPFRVLAATSHDLYRKPMVGMWNYLLKTSATPLVQGECLFVGDAVGRPKDHSDSDRKFALNAGISCQTPEEYFLKLGPEPFKLSGYLPTAILATTAVTPEPWPTPTKPELVLLVGRPKSGKTYYFTTLVKPAGYSIVSTPLQIPFIGKLLKDGKSVVVDANTGSLAQRRKLLAIANYAQVLTRCVFFDVDDQHAWHINVYQAFSAPNPTWKITPEGEFVKYNTAFNPPQLDEGISEIITVAPSFNATSEADLLMWQMWHLPFPRKK